MEVLVRAAESGWVPDPFIRWGIRKLVSERLEDEKEMAFGRVYE